MMMTITFLKKQTLAYRSVIVTSLTQAHTDVKIVHVKDSVSVCGECQFS